MPADRAYFPRAAPQLGVRNLLLSREGPGGHDNSRANTIKRLNAQQGGGGLIAPLRVHALEPRLDCLRAISNNVALRHLATTRQSAVLRAKLAHCGVMRYLGFQVVCVSAPRARPTAQRLCGAYLSSNVPRDDVAGSRGVDRGRREPDATRPLESHEHPRQPRAGGTVLRITVLLLPM